jgi:hypothetical protein
MSEFHGFLFSKLDLIGSRSEGPTYFLQQFDYSEIPIEKRAELWQEDPNLQEVLATKVTVIGNLSAGGLGYDSVRPYSPAPTTAEREETLRVALRLNPEEIRIDKMPPAPLVPALEITLEVEWPYRSIWRGICPTTQIYDFFVEFEGKTKWQWSQGKFFAPALTPVAIPGGSPHAFTETWIIKPDTVKGEGLYTVRGLFIASGQVAERQIQIRITH